MRKRKHYLQPVAAGFMAVYLVIMTAVTWLVHDKFMDEFEMRYNNCFENSRQHYRSIYESLNEDDTRISEEYHYAMAIWAWDTIGDTSYLKKYQQFSFAFYDKITQKMYSMQESFSINTLEAYYADEDRSFIIGEPLNQYLTDQEIKSLALFLLKKYRSAYNINLESYECYAKMDRESRELCGFVIQKAVWEKNSDSHPVGNPLTYSYYTAEIESGSHNGLKDVYVPIAYEIVWEWNNPNVTEPDDWYMVEYCGLEFNIPHLQEGYDIWKKWRNSTYLQKSIQTLDIDILEKMIDTRSEAEEPFEPEYCRAAVIRSGLDKELGILFVASECHPWIAAFDYMKWVYLSCFVLMLFCITVVVHVLDKTDRKKLEIEENRRNFTHTLALKMKQPLDIIRELKENLLNSGNENCLKQIVAETETMDHLVGEMIDMSKLDSEHLVFQKDMLSMGDIIREEFAKLEPLIAERQLTIRIEETMVFIVTGDKKYLSKAIYNLLDNAVRYSDAGGTIRVVTDSKYCSIENSCSPTEIYPGAGLYLAQKILHLCQLVMEIQNTDKGIKIVIC